MTSELRFFWNGIKVGTGKLQTCYYSDGELRSFPAHTITISARDYRDFSAEVADAFTVENNSDGQTDYFEHDHIRVTTTHPLYSKVWKAMQERNAHYDKKYASVA